jgi:hypothetical protein
MRKAVELNKGQHADWIAYYLTKEQAEILGR